VTVYAHGRQLLPDTGAFTYSDDPRSVWLRDSTESQTTIEIDGKAQQRGAEADFETFVTNRSFDFVRVWTDATPGVRHTRTVLFVRPELWLVTDHLHPSSDQSHRYRQNWHFLPDANPVISQDSLATVTSFAEGANLWIVPADPQHLSAQLNNGYYSPRFYAVSDTTYTTYTREESGPAIFDTLLLPTPGMATKEPVLERLSVTGASVGEASAISADFGSGRTAAYCVAHPATSANGQPQSSQGQLTFGSHSFDGTFAYLERYAQRQKWLLYGGHSLTSEEVLIDSPKELKDLAVELDPASGNVTITGTELVPSTSPVEAIRIGAPWARSVTLNGRAVQFERHDGAVLAAAVG
jgi:hypothetical protein